ncbi:alpha/beta hydrolase [Streptomyces sp. NPDC054784]
MRRRPPRRRRLAPLLAVSVTATLAPVLATSTASAAPTTPTASASASPAAAKGALDPYVRQKPDWKRCAADDPADFECAVVEVPLDYREPDGERLDLAISRLRGTDPDKHEGILLSNPGGPGGEGLRLPMGLRGDLPKEARQKYDLVGFDPRGVGRSSPVTCGLESDEEDWLRPYKEETFDEDVAWARTVADKCREKAGDVLPHITTRNTARDMDLVRAILGEKKISYLGYSYGTYLGAVYTQLFPDRADRFVLDSAVDPARAWRGMIQWWAEGAEPAFDRWTEWAAERSSTYHLGDTPKKVDATFWDLVARADEKPVEWEGQKADGDAIRDSMRGGVFSPKEASEWLVELLKAADGEPAAPKRPTAVPGSGWDATGNAKGAESAAGTPTDNMTATFWAVVCGDHSAAWSRDPETYRQDAVEDKGRFPLYGDFASSIKPCAFWDESAEPVTEVDNGVGGLVVQNEWDPQTPLPSGQALHEDLKGSRMVTVRGGEGHGVYPNGTACADGAVNAYLTRGELPAGDVTCDAPAGEKSEARERRHTAPTPERAPDRF